VRETYADQLGDLINLDFAPKTAAAPAAAAPAASATPAKPKVTPTAAARAAAKKN
jgi:hypothetical protein